MSVTNPNTKTADTPLRYRVDDLLVDVGRRCVSRDGVELDITGRSFELLLALIRAAPNALSLDQLMSEVWRGMVVNSETVTQRVKVLRQALGDQPEQPRYIASVRGHGYRLLAELAPLADATGKPASESDRHAPQESASETTQAQNTQAPTRSPAYRRIAVPIIAIALLGLLVLGVWWFTRTNTQAPRVARDSVAVLPFANLTGDASKEYLGDGMADELINTLTKVQGLKVPARTSTFAYKGRNTDIRQIAKDLQVGTILEGSVRAADKHIRITAQLIDAQDGLHIWSESYDEEFTDIFKLQDKLARQIAQALQPNLNGAAIEAVTQAPPTRDVEAYNLYLQGVSLVSRTSAVNAPRAIDYFQQALARDPNFARAYAMIAEAQLGWATVDSLHTATHAIAAEDAARHALALDPVLATPHTALAGMSMYRSQWLEMGSHLQAAVASGPEDAYILVVYATQLSMVGKTRDALETGRKAYILAPANPFVLAYVALIHSLAGREQDAQRYAQAARDLGYPADSYPLPTIDLLSALRAGRYSQATEMVGRLISNSNSAGKRGALVLSQVFTALADPSKRVAVLSAATIASSENNPSFKDREPCVAFGTSYALLGAIDAAYQAVGGCSGQAAADATFGSFPILLLHVLPEMRAFRADPRFQSFITRMGLMDYYQQYGPPDDCDLKDGKLICH